MIVQREIEIDEDNYIEVEFEGIPKRQNDSYSDEYGLVKMPDYAIVENIDWDRTAFTTEENSKIQEYLGENYSSVEYEIIQKEKDYYSW